MPAAILPTGDPLVGHHVRLDLLSEADLDELYPLLTDPAVYASGYVMHRRPTSPEDGRAVGRERFLKGHRLHGERTTYAVRLTTDGTLVGTSSLLEANVVDESIHLGSTLYGSRWWGTRVNPEAKLLLLAHCFDTCGYGRVKIQTDVLNVRSRAAIARLGAVEEGVPRRDKKREDGTFRDTVVFSVLAAEWPAVRAGLEARLR